MKRILSFVLAGLFLFAINAEALNLSRVKTWSAEVLTHTDLNAEFDNILNHSITNADISATAGIVGSKLDLSSPGAIGGTVASTGDFTTFAASGNVQLGDAAADSVLFKANDIQLEGSTDDTNELTVTVTDPTADRTLTIPDANSVTLPTGAMFYMISGSCPPGTTDITSTYSNKFVRINASQADTGGSATLAGNSGDTTLTAAQSGLPSHTHTIPNSSAGGGPDSISGTAGTQDKNTGSTGGTPASSAHNHSLTSVALVPEYVTAIMCSVD